MSASPTPKKQSLFAAAESSERVGVREYEARAEPLRLELLALQKKLRQRDHPVIVLLDGEDRLGMNDTLNELHAWLDPRDVVCHAYRISRVEEPGVPFLSRYWSELPAAGRIGIFMRSWAMETIVDRFFERLDERTWLERRAAIRDFETLLADSGVVLVKLWLHLPEEVFRARLVELPQERERLWLSVDEELRLSKKYRLGERIAEEFLADSVTAAGGVPWVVIDSSDQRTRQLRVLEELRKRLAASIDGAPASAAATRTPSVATAPTPAPSVPLEPPAASDADGISESSRDPLGSLDLTRSLSKVAYREKLARWQEKLGREALRALAAQRATVIVFEGWDAAGKGGAIRRVTAAIDAALYHVARISAPTDEELAQPYLWRFWRRLPDAGRISIFDRSWYGRVLVERIEGYARAEEWRRAYDEINAFERQLVEAGVVLLKFWIHIDREEQLRRFAAREQDAAKQHKITADDYRNRERWHHYEEAVTEMIERTDSRRAPWHLIAGNDKRWARVRVVRRIAKELARARKRS